VRGSCYQALGQNPEEGTLSDGLNQVINEYEYLLQEKKASYEKIEQLENERTDLERVVESLKQIIILQDKMRDNQYGKASQQLRAHVMKSIESF